jgi:DNA-binding transcriptional LysR family regulator
LNSCLASSLPPCIAVLTGHGSSTMRNFRRLKTGSTSPGVQINSFVTFGKSASLKLCHAFPNAELINATFLLVETRGTTGIHTLVSKDEVDVGLTTPPPPRAGLQFEPMYTEAIVALVPEAYPFSTGEAIPPGELAKTRVILTNPTCAYREVIERVLIEQGVRLNATLEIGSLLTLKQIVQDGLGIALLPEMATRTIPKGTMVKPIEQFDLRIPIGLVRKPDMIMLLQTNTLDMFISLLKRALQAIG